MKTIPLTQGQVTMVGDEDYPDLSGVKWYALWDRDTKGFYAVRHLPRSSGGRRTEQMSRRILGLSHGDKRQADHRNHDTLDNRRKNLRVTTHRGNGKNRRDQSPYGVGVGFQKHCPFRPYGARAKFGGRYYYIGSFTTAGEARSARVLWLIRRGL